MIYSIDGELTIPTNPYSIPIYLKTGSNLYIYTSIPFLKGKKVEFRIQKEGAISYYFGDFHYQFAVEFEGEDKDSYKFIIHDVKIEKNLRKQKRKLMETNALILDSHDMYYGTLLDLSENGCKLETGSPIAKKKIEVHYVSENGETIKRKGKIIRESYTNNHYYYGVKLK